VAFLDAPGELNHLICWRCVPSLHVLYSAFPAVVRELSMLCFARFIILIGFSMLRPSSGPFRHAQSPLSPCRVTASDCAKMNHPSTNSPRGPQFWHQSVVNEATQHAHGTCTSGMLSIGSASIRRRVRAISSSRTCCPRLF
jgi:hypothetical protein